MDPALAPGQHLYIADRRWKRINAKGTPIAYRTECLTETWSSAFGAPDFGQTQTMTGNIQWISGIVQNAESYGLNPPPAGPARGELHCAPPLRHNVDTVYPWRWQSPSRAILDSVPGSPQEVLAALRQSVPLSENEWEVFSTAGKALETGLYPTRLRTRIYQALALLPQVTITPKATMLDGRTGIEFSLTTSTDLFALIVDPRTGQLIGTRKTAVKDLVDRDISGDLKSGTVIDESVLTYGVSAKYGERPAK